MNIDMLGMDSGANDYMIQTWRTMWCGHTSLIFGKSLCICRQIFRLNLSGMWDIPWKKTCNIDKTNQPTAYLEAFKGM